MELPFAVESSDSGIQNSTLAQSDSSLVTASSQDSYMNSSNLDGPLPPNTPQDVVLPRYESRQHPPSHPGHPPPPPRISGPLPSPRDDEPEVIDFTYVNISEDDAEDAGILLEGGDFDLQEVAQRGDILTVLLGGMEQHGNEAVLVSRMWSVCFEPLFLSSDFLFYFRLGLKARTRLQRRQWKQRRLEISCQHSSIIPKLRNCTATMPWRFGIEMVSF